MGSYHALYGSSNEGLSASYGNTIGKSTVSAGSFSLATDPRTANQLKATSEKLNTGAKGVEVNFLMPEVAESIPKQHVEELNRLRKLVGAQLTVHGPLVEPSGINPQQGACSPEDRVEAERQLWATVERAHQVNPDGNVMVTVHSSNGLPEPEKRIMQINPETGKREEFIQTIGIVNERSGKVQLLPAPSKDYLELGKGMVSAKESLNKINDDQWKQNVSELSMSASRAEDFLSHSRANVGSEEEQELIKKINQEDVFRLSRTPEWTSYLKQLSQGKDDEQGALAKQIASRMANNLTYGKAVVDQSYVQFKGLFNEAYSALKDKSPEDKAKLDKFSKEIAPILETYQKKTGDLSVVRELSEKITEGISVLDNMKEKPKLYTELKQFAIDKASETFANVALKSYNAFENGKSSPIISIENPPVGMGLSRGEELRTLIDESRRKFAEKAMKENGLSKEEATAQAEKLIGATWDVGHINMMRKYGYDDKDILEETKKIGGVVKHMHLSDNFGFEHTELPMGMGNVPMEGHLQILKEKFKGSLDEMKKVIEVGQWYQHFQTTPFSETLEAFGSPVYGMNMTPYWNQAARVSGGYFAGYGSNPDVHHSMYGAGFANLPTELGGQMSGRSRMSGNPME